MATVDEIRAVITAEVGGLRREMARAADAVGALRKESERSFGQMTRSMKATETGLASFGRAFRAAISIALIRAAAREFQQLSDASTNLTARLKTATGGGEAFAQAQREVVRIAQVSRQEIGAVGEIYARFANATKDLGVEQAVVARAVETLNKAVVVSGATAQEARAAMIQLSQGLASGRLQGEELRSALEQLPIVVRLISKETGIAFGQIREAAAKGLIGPKEVLAALVRGAEEIDTAFAQFPVTIEQALTLVNNEMFLLVQAFNEGTSASNEIAGAIQDFGRFLRENRTEIVEYASTIVAAFREAFGFVAFAVSEAQQRIAEFLGLLQIKELTGVGFFENFFTGEGFKIAEQRIGELEQKIRDLRETISKIDPVQVDVVGLKIDLASLERERDALRAAIGQVASGSLDPLGKAADAAAEKLGKLNLNFKGTAEGAGLSEKALKALNKELANSIKHIEEVVKAQDAAAKSASDFFGGLQRDALALTPAQAKLADLSEEIRKLEALPADAMIDFAGGIMRAADAAEILRTKGVEAIVDTGKAAEQVAEQTSNAASSIGEAFKTAFEGIALGTRELKDIPDLFKDAFAKAFFETLYEKSGFDKAFKGNIFDLIKTVGGFLTGSGGFTDFFSQAFSAILGDKKGFDAAFSGGAAGGGSGFSGAGLAAGAATLGGAAAGGLGGAYLGGKLGGAVGGKTGAMVGQLGGGLLGAKLGANVVAGLVSYLQGGTALSAVASVLQSTVGTAATAALADAGLISLGAAGASTAAPAGGAAGSSAGSAAGGLGATGIGAIVAAAVLGAIQTASSVQRALGGDVAGGATQNALDPLGILGFAGVDIASVLGLGNTQTKGVQFRDQIGGFTRDLFPDLELLFNQFDEAEAKFPDLFKDALPPIRAVATAIAELADSPLETADEVSQLVNVLVNSMGEAGVGAEEAAGLAREAFNGLGISAAEAGLVAQEALAAGRLSAEEFTQTIVGLAEISGVTFEEMTLQIELLGETFLDTSERMAIAMLDLAEIIIEDGQLNLANLELQLRAAFAAGQIGAADVARGVADMTAAFNTASEVLGTTGVEAFLILRNAGVASFDDLKNLAIGDIAKIIQEIDKLGIDGATFLRVLRDNGIASFTDLANASQEQINAILSALGEIPSEIHTEHIISETHTGGAGLPPGTEGAAPPGGDGGGVSTKPPGYTPPAAQLGGFVSQSGLAVIHRGEEVVTQELVKKLDNFARGSRASAAPQILVVPVVDRNDLPQALARLKRERRIVDAPEPDRILGVRGSL